MSFLSSVITQTDTEGLGVLMDKLLASQWAVLYICPVNDLQKDIVVKATGIAL